MDRSIGFGAVDRWISGGCLEHRSFDQPNALQSENEVSDERERERIPIQKRGTGTGTEAESENESEMGYQV